MLVPVIFVIRDTKMSPLYSSRMYNLGGWTETTRPHFVEHFAPSKKMLSRAQSVPKTKNIMKQRSKTQIEIHGAVHGAFRSFRPAAGLQN